MYFLELIIFEFNQVFHFFQVRGWTYVEMRGFGRLLEAVVEFRTDMEARDAIILDGKMWGTSKLKVTKKENAGKLHFPSWLL